MINMELILEDIGIIERAEIRLDGLTVIAGNNDSGKSTVGKIAYSLTKSYEDFDLNYERDRMQEIEKFYREFYVILRKNIDFKENIEFQKFMDKYLYYRNINDKKLLELMKNLLNMINKGEINVNKETLKIIIDFLKRIENIYQKKESKDSKIIRSVIKVFESEFRNQINYILKKESRITALEGKNEIIRLIIKNNNIIQDISVKIDEIFPFESSIFIETPFILTYKDALEYSDDIYHVNDLLKKLESPNINYNKRKLNISNIIKGEIHFDEEEDSFIYKKKIGENLTNIKMLNSASGIKSFGLLQLLENSGELDKNNLLIIDEPEVHLHPDWQVEYARLLVKLVKNGTTVLITSHSPYLIEAINKYSIKENIKNKTRFYLSEVQDNGKALIKDKTNDKDEIFDKLSKPFERLIFGD